VNDRVVSVNDRVVSVNDGPVSVNDGPVSVNDDPVSVNDGPVSVNDRPGPKNARPGPTRADEDECSVCLDVPVHPVTLPCGHSFCYLCAKGLAMCDTLAQPLCSLCRRPFPRDYLGSAKVLQDASLDMNDTPPLEADDEQWQWFYQGNKGWWRFEERNNDEIEDCFKEGADNFETLICGKLYTIDFRTMDQYQTSYPNRKRRIKRDRKSTQCKGVAGLQKRSWNRPLTSD